MAETTRIRNLDELDDMKVAEHDPDVRGWEVVGAGDRRVGKVDRLLVDTGAMKVRYLDVELDGDALDLDEDRHLLVPVGYARLHRDDDTVHVDELTTSRASALPAYTHDPLTTEYETELRRGWDASYRGTYGDDFYDHDAFDTDRFYGPRRGDPAV